MSGQASCWRRGPTKPKLQIEHCSRGLCDFIVVGHHYLDTRGFPASGEMYLVRNNEPPRNARAILARQ